MKNLVIPTLDITNFAIAPVKDKIIILQELACSICTALSAYPHFVVVNGYPAI